MTVRSVLKWPNPELKNIAEPVEEIDDAIISLAQDMKDTMSVEFGIGLAATQIGISKSLTVLKGSFHSVSPLKQDPVISDCIVLVNPEIEIVGDESFKWAEACLSVPDIEAEVQRHKNIKLTYTDLSKEKHTVELTNQNAGLVQHEVDHLFGKLFIDRLKGESRRKVLSKLRNLLRAKARARVKAAKEAKHEARAEAESPRPGFRSSPTSKHKKASRPPKKYGKNKRRRKK